MGITVTSTVNRAELLLTREIDRFVGRRNWQRHHQSAFIVSAPRPRDEPEHAVAESGADVLPVFNLTYATVGCHPETLGLECARRGKSHDRASEPDQSRTRLRHGEAANTPVFAIAFLWQAVRGRLLPGRFPRLPVSDPRTVCHHTASERWVAAP